MTNPEALGVDIPIRVVYTLDGEPTNAFTTPPTLWKAVNPAGEEFTPTNTAVVPSDAGVDYIYTLAGADTTLYGGKLYRFYFKCLDPTADYENYDDEVSVGITWIQTTQNTYSLLSGLQDDIEDTYLIVDDLTSEDGVLELSEAALTNVPDGSVDTDAISAAVWNRQTSLINVVGSIGKYIVDFLASIKGKTDLITTENVFFTSPVEPITLKLTIVRGDDYTVASGRTLPEWSSEDWTVFNLTDDDTEVVLKTRINNEVEEFPLVVVDDETVRFVATSEETSQFNSTCDVYEIEATLANGSIITLVTQSKLRVIMDIR